MIYRCKSLFKDENNYFYRVFTILVDQISMHAHEQSSCWAWAGVSLFWGQFIFGLCKCILFFFFYQKKLNCVVENMLLRFQVVEVDHRLANNGKVVGPLWRTMIKKQRKNMVADTAENRNKWARVLSRLFAFAYNIDRNALRRKRTSKTIQESRCT